MMRAKAGDLNRNRKRGMIRRPQRPGYTGSHQDLSAIRGHRSENPRRSRTKNDKQEKLTITLMTMGLLVSPIKAWR